MGKTKPKWQEFQSTGIGLFRSGLLLGSWLSVRSTVRAGSDLPVYSNLAGYGRLSVSSRVDLGSTLSVKFICGDRRKREPFFELTDNRETNFGTSILSSSGAFLCGTSMYARGYARLGSSLSIQAIYLVGRAASIFDSVHLAKALLNKLIASIGREPFEFRIGKGLIHRVVT